MATFAPDNGTPSVGPASVPRVIVALALYRDGVRAGGDPSLHQVANSAGDGALAWVGLCRPSGEELQAVAAAFDLPELAVEDTAHAHQRPKLERYGDTLFVVLHPARYIDATETVEFDEIHIFVGPAFVVTVRHGRAPDLAALRRDLDARPDVLRRGPRAVLHAIMDLVVDDYAPVLAGIENDIDEIEDQVFGEAAGNVSKRTYELTREVIALQRAIKPLPAMLAQLMAEHDTGAPEHRDLRDVQDHALRLQEQADANRQLLESILHVNLTVETKALTEAANRQGEEVKRISAWAAILFAPTLVGTVYGMNFEHMPELGWQFGYPFSLVLMLAVSGGLYILFRRRGWI